MHEVSDIEGIQILCENYVKILKVDRFGSKYEYNI